VPTVGGTGLLGCPLDGHGLRLPQRAQYLLQGVRKEGNIRSHREVRLRRVRKAAARWRHTNFRPSETKLRTVEFYTIYLIQYNTIQYEIAAGELVVAAPKFVESVMWHPKCFTCSTCNLLLVDLTYCVHDDKVYCERHYAEMLKPRCAGCDEVSS